MSNTESIPSGYDQSSVDSGWARELTQACAELELPYEVPTGCGAKAIAIMSFLRLRGVRRDDIGVAMSYIPDLSPEGIQVAETEHDAMRFKQSPYSFAKRLATGRGRVDMGAKAVEWGGVRLTETEMSGNSYVVAERLAPANIVERGNGSLPDLLSVNKWHLLSPGEDVYMCNHTAAMLAGKVIDPGYEKDRPLSLEEWRECQEFPAAVLLSSTAVGTAVPFRAHTELLLPEQRRQYDTLLEEVGVTHEAVGDKPSAYRTAMRSFFNLESGVLEDNPADTIEQRISRLRAVTILEGDDNYKLPPDESCEAELNYRTGRLNLAMVYQQWLQETDAVLDE